MEGQSVPEPRVSCCEGSVPSGFKPGFKWCCHWIQNTELRILSNRTSGKSEVVLDSMFDSSFMVDNLSFMQSLERTVCCLYKIKMNSWMVRVSDKLLLALPDWSNLRRGPPSTVFSIGKSEAFCKMGCNVMKCSETTKCHRVLDSPERFRCFSFGCLLWASRNLQTGGTKRELIKVSDK